MYIYFYINLFTYIYIYIYMNICIHIWMPRRSTTRRAPPRPGSRRTPDKVVLHKSIRAQICQLILYISYSKG